MNYEFIIEGCPNPDEPDADSLQIIANGQAAAASFSLASFMFHEDLDAEIYLHCQVNPHFTAFCIDFQLKILIKSERAAPKFIFRFTFAILRRSNAPHNVKKEHMVQENDDQLKII